MRISNNSLRKYTPKSSIRKKVRLNLSPRRKKLRLRRYPPVRRNIRRIGHPRFYGKDIPGFLTARQGRAACRFAGNLPRRLYERISCKNLVVPESVHLLSL